MYVLEKNCWQQNCIFSDHRKRIWSDGKNPSFSTNFLKFELHKKFFLFWVYVSINFLAFFGTYSSSFLSSGILDLLLKSDLIFREFFCHKVSSVCDLIDLFSKVSVIDIYQSAKRSGLSTSSIWEFLLYATTYLMLLHYW